MANTDIVCLRLYNDPEKDAIALQNKSESVKFGSQGSFSSDPASPLLDLVCVHGMSEAIQTTETVEGEL